MYYTFNCIAVSNPLSFKMEAQPKTTEFFMKLLSIFSQIRDNKLHLMPVHRIGTEHKRVICELISQYDKICIQLKGVNSYFKKLSDGEHVYISIDDPKSNNPDQFAYIYELLRLLNSGTDPSQIPSKLEVQMKQYSELFKSVTENYDFIPISPSKKKLYGEPDKQKRTCRYCGNTAENTTFKETAHAFPESLGNKTILSAEECDICNSDFSSTIDSDAFEYFKIIRTLYSKKGKDGIPTLKFKNGEIRHVDGVPCISFVSEEECFKDGSGSIPFEYFNKLNLMNVYRCLVKFVIGVIDKKELQYFEKTIKWINKPYNTGAEIPLPKLAMLLDRWEFHDQPSLLIYKRKTKNVDLPYMHAELRISCFIYVFIIPFCSADSKDFSYDENYSCFWKVNTHYTKFDQWIYEEFNLDQAVDFTFNLNISHSGQ